MNGPAQRLFSEYKSLVGVMYEHRFSVDKDQDLLFRLTNIETLLTLAGILPLLHEMNVLVKMAQSHTMYIAEYTNARKLSCHELGNLYTMPGYFTSPMFNGWKNLIDIEKIENYLKFDENGRLCMAVCGYMVPFHYVSNMGQTTKECRVSRDQFNDIVISVRHNLIQIAQSLSLEIREQFPQDELLEAMSLQVDFLEKLSILVHHFGRNVNVQGEDIGGILDSSKFI